MRLLALYSPVLVVLVGGALRMVCDGAVLYASVALALLLTLIVHYRAQRHDRAQRH